MGVWFFDSRYMKPGPSIIISEPLWWVATIGTPATNGPTYHPENFLTQNDRF
jgi:hypothetical protein